MTDRDSYFNPYFDGGVTRIKEKAGYSGEFLARSHYPDAVITDEGEIRQLAQRVCKSWWGNLEKSGRTIDYDEVSRVYVSTFVASYVKGVDSATPYKEKAAREKQLAQKAARP